MLYRFRDSFPKKIRLLREVHNLSTIQVAEFFSFKVNASISDLEVGRVNPTLATLDTIVNFFSVSIDWLAGKSSIIYQEEILNAIEDELRADMITNNPQLYYYQLLTWWIRGSKRYSQRKQVFSLPVRANIIFCLQVLRKASLFFNAQRMCPEINSVDLDGIGIAFEPLLQDEVLGEPCMECAHLIPSVWYQDRS